VKRAVIWYGYMVASSLCLALLITLAFPRPASAQELHAVLLRSDPAAGSTLPQPPTAIRLWFSEPVQLVGQPITVFAPSGAQFTTGGAREQGGEVEVPVHPLQQGTYLVSWQVISNDTHPASGSFTFSIGHAGGPWTETVGGGLSPAGFWLQVSSHLLHFLGYALGFGTLAFLLLVLAPLKLTHEPILLQLWRLCNLGILILILAEGVALCAQVISLSPSTSFYAPIAAELLASSFGRLLALRLAAAFLLWICLGAVRQDYRKGVTAALVVGIALAFIDGTASHALSARLLWLALIANTLHISSMGVWLGGLITLLVLWGEKVVQGSRLAMLHLFGKLAAIAVVELALTGIMMAWLIVARPEDILVSTYGLVLVSKAVALLAPLLFVVLSRRNLHERERWWRLEALTLLGVITLAAILVTLPPL